MTLRRVPLASFRAEQTHSGSGSRPRSSIHSKALRRAKNGLHSFRKSRPCRSPAIRDLRNFRLALRLCERERLVGSKIKGVTGICPRSCCLTGLYHFHSSPPPSSSLSLSTSLPASAPTEAPCCAGCQQHYPCARLLLLDAVRRRASFDVYETAAADSFMSGVAYRALCQPILFTTGAHLAFRGYGQSDDEAARLASPDIPSSASVPERLRSGSMPHLEFIRFIAGHQLYCVCRRSCLEKQCLPDGRCYK